MKILHIINSMDMGGAQSLLVELMPLQKDKGHEVTILELQSSDDRTLINKVEKKGVKVISIRGGKSVYSFIKLFKIVPYLSQYDIVHVHLFPAQYWAILAKLISRSKTPLVTTEHSTTNKRRNSKIFRIIEPFFYNRYEKVIACSEKALEIFKLCYPSVKAISISNGVSINKYLNAKPYSKQKLLGISDDSFLVTMVARFIPSKRQDTLVQAIAQMPERFHALFVGGQKADDGLIKIQKLAEDLNVRERVHFLYLRGDVPKILKSSDAIVMSSEYEGLSLSSIEGMASGKPFIASDVNGLREVVKGAGVLVKCGDLKQLSDEILKLAADKVYYNSIALQCMERAALYDINDVVDKHLEEYNKIIIK